MSSLIHVLGCLITLTVDDGDGVDDRVWTRVSTAKMSDRHTLTITWLVGWPGCSCASRVTTQISLWRLPCPPTHPHEKVHCCLSPSHESLLSGRLLMLTPNTLSCSHTCNNYQIVSMSWRSTCVVDDASRAGRESYTLCLMSRLPSESERLQN